MPALMILGLLAGVGIAAWLLGQSEGEDVGFIDSIGDFWVSLTTTEETRIAQLQPEVQSELRMLLSDLFADGVPVSVGQTLRTSAQEKALIESGKTAASLKISWHQLGRAVDLYPLNDMGVADRDGKDIDKFRRMHQLAAARGWRGIAFNADGSKRLIANSKGKLVWDGGHLEWRAPYGSIAEAVAAEGEQYGLA
jgi:hypothetical protein